MSKAVRTRTRPLPPNLDVDRFIQFVLDEVAGAAKGWKNGDPCDETAFMNRLTERLKIKRRKCDVGKASPMGAETSTYVLHRKGENQTDKYGADIAVTLDIENCWRKTVIFQLKKSHGYEVRLNKDDLKASDEDPLIADRSFVLAIDEERLGVRIAKVDRLNRTFKASKNKSVAFDTNKWLFLYEWLDQWLRCGLAPNSPTDGSPGPEGLLEGFRTEPIEVDEDYPFEPSDIGHLDYVPARIWFQAGLQEKEKK